MSILNETNSVSELQEQFNDFLNNCNVSNDPLTGIISNNKILSEAVEITPEKIENAKKWSLDNNINIMYPCDDIDELHNKYLDQHKALRRKADWKAMELFGCDNEQLYYMLKKNINIKYGDTNDEDVFNMGNRLVELDNLKINGNSDIAEINHEQKTILNNLRQISENKKYKWEFFYAPYFEPKEIIALEGHYYDEVEESSKAIFKEYQDYCYGFNNNFNIIEWDNEVRKLTSKLEFSSFTNIDEINKTKQSLVQLGWNPEIKYTTENQIKAKNRLENIFNEYYKNVNMISLESQFAEFDESEYVQESIKEKLHSISIVLVKGETIVSKAITSITHGKFSHAALCLDGNFKQMYSFNMNNNVSNHGGFSIEDIEKYPKGHNLAVFSFFINDEQYYKLKKNIDWLTDHLSDTYYSIINLVTAPFKNINLNMDMSMICSQFVDRILKLINIDLTNIDSSKVTPEYFYRRCIKNSKIYKIFDGFSDKFNHIKASKFIDNFSSKSKPINEGNILYEYTVNQYLYPVVTESFETDPDGLFIEDNIIIKNPSAKTIKSLYDYIL